MREHSQARVDRRCRADGIAISRRVVVGSSGLAILGVLSGAASAREASEGERRGMPRDVQDRMEESRAFAERMKNAASMEERMKIMAEHSVRERARAIEEFKGQLGVSDEEWTVIKPRIETVYDMVHSAPQFGPGSTQSMSPVDQKKRELRVLLDNKDTTPDQIKAGLAALRAANEKVRQDLVKARENLRGIVTLRQEATLVLNGLLD